MKEQIRREVKICAQYFALALVSGVAAFVLALPHGGREGEIAVAVNIREAWLNYEPMLRSWLLGFAFLSIIRLLIIYIARSGQNRTR
jgi:uncharacterized membrane protein